MASQVNLRGNPVKVDGDFPQVGDHIADCVLTGVDLSEKRLYGFSGLRKILNIFPSVDTPTCATSVRKFNHEASTLERTAVLCISADLPFAQQRFCGAEGLDQVHVLSTFRHPEFLKQLGVALSEGPLAGLAARAVVVLDEDHRVIHAELVEEIGQEPDYASAIKALSTALA
jgi:thiol peroxidase